MWTCLWCAARVWGYVRDDGVYQHEENREVEVVFIEDLLVDNDDARDRDDVEERVENGLDVGLDDALQRRL
jgi:hypothetical protein